MNKSTTFHIWTVLLAFISMLSVHAVDIQIGLFEDAPVRIVSESNYANTIAKKASFLDFEQGWNDRETLPCWSFETNSLTILLHDNSFEKDCIAVTNYCGFYYSGSGSDIPLLRTNETVCCRMKVDSLYLSRQVWTNHVLKSIELIQVDK